MSKEKTMINDLTQGSVTNTLFTFAAPFMLSNLLQTVYNLVDMVVIGQFVGSTGLSAVSIGGEMLHLLTFICMGFCSAGQITISQYVGAGDRNAVSRVIGNLFTCILILAVALTAVGISCADWMLSIMNTPEEAFSQAMDYTLVCFWGTVFIFGYNVVSSILRGMGDSKRPFVFIAVAAVINLVLDLVFVAGFNWGAWGAALATVIGQAASFIGSLIYLYIKREAFGFDFKPKSFIPEWQYVKILMRLGLPMCFQYCAIMISALFVQSYINAYGVVASAVNGVGNKLSSVMSVVTNAINNAGSAMIGQNLGAGKTNRVNRVIGSAMTFCLAVATVLSAIMVIMPRQVFGLFNSDPEVLEMAMEYVPIAVLSFYGFALRAPFNALINGLGHASLGLIIGLMDGVVARVGLAILLGVTLDLGIHGFWYGNVAAGYVPFIMGLIYYLSGKWKTRKLVIH